MDSPMQRKSLEPGSKLSTERKLSIAAAITTLLASLIKLLEALGLL